MRTFVHNLKYLEESEADNPPELQINIFHAENDEEANELLDELDGCLIDSKFLGFDSETTGLYPEGDAEMRLLQLSTRISETEFNSFTFDIWQCSYATKERFRLICESEEIAKVGQNLKFDIKFVKKLFPRPMRFGTLFDVMIAHQVLLFGHVKQGENNLRHIANRFLELDLSKSEQTSDWSAPILSDDQLIYAGLDAVIPLLIREQMNPLIQADSLQNCLANMFSAVEPVAKFEFDGILLNQERWRKEAEKTLDRIEEISNQIYELLPPATQSLFDDVPREFNIGSTKELAERLFVQGIELPQSEKGNALKNKAALEEIEHLHPAIKLLLEYAKLKKRRDAYGLAWFHKINEVTQRIHATFNVLWADTSRMSCFNPNLQQIPRGDELRGCFEARKGWKMIAADYSQIELRILADFSNDKAMLEGFTSGRDFHTTTAALIFEVDYEDVTGEQRYFAKTLNFGIVYGIGARRFATMVGIDVEEAEEIIDSYKARFKAMSQYLDDAARRAVKFKRCYTKSGFISKFYFDRTDKQMKAAVERKGKNTPIQGTSADILRRALRLLFDEVYDKPYIKLVNIVHDEIVIEVKDGHEEEAAEILHRVMVKAGEEYLQRCPVKVDVTVSDRWKKD